MGLDALVAQALVVLTPVGVWVSNVIHAVLPFVK
jgi:hypothetical protein